MGMVKTSIRMPCVFDGLRQGETMTAKDALSGEDEDEKSSGRGR